MEWFPLPGSCLGMPNTLMTSDLKLPKTKYTPQDSTDTVGCLASGDLHRAPSATSLTPLDSQQIIAEKDRYQQMKETSEMTGMCTRHDTLMMRRHTRNCRLVAAIGR